MAKLEIVALTTSGDRIRDRPLSDAGGKGLFTKELEEALLARRIDIAVHSMKDMATNLPSGLAIGAVLVREDVRDAFVSLNFAALSELPSGAKVGTSSIRRRAQVRLARPDLEIVDFRGNVDTRLRKLEAGIADATLLACAGLNRLGQADRITAAISVSDMLPAVAQGAIAIEVCDEAGEIGAAVALLDDPATHACVRVERAFLRELDGSCRTPIAALAEWAGEEIELRGEILRTDGSQRLGTIKRGPAAMMEDEAAEAARELLAQAGADFFTEQG